MSTPHDPYAAPQPDDQQPSYGQAPQYGQGQPPSYGQAPQYGQGQPPSYGQAPPYGQGQHPPSYGQYGQPPYPYAGYLQGYGPPPGPPRRPGTLIAASILNWVGSGFLLLAGIGLAVASPSTTFQGDLDSDASTVLAVGVVCLALAIASLVLSVFAWQGKQWAVIVLSVLAGLFILGGLVSLVRANGGGVVAMAWLGVATGLYWGTPSRAFYRSR